MINRKIKKQILAIALSSVFLFTSSNSLVSSLAVDVDGDKAPTTKVDEKQKTTDITDNNINATVDDNQVARFHFKDGIATATLNTYKADSQGNGYLMIDIRKDFVKGYSDKFFTKDDNAMTITTNFSGGNKTIVENNYSSYKSRNNDSGDYIRFYIPYYNSNKKPIKVTFNIPDAVQDRLNKKILEAKDDTAKKDALKVTEMRATFFSDDIKADDLLNKSAGELTFNGDTPKDGFTKIETYTSKEDTKIYKGFVFDEEHKVLRIKPDANADRIRLYLGANSSGFSYNSSFGDIDVQYYNNGSTYRKVNDGKPHSSNEFKNDEYKRTSLSVSSGFNSVEIPWKTTDGIIEIKMIHPNNMLLNLKVEAYPNINVDSGSSDTTDKPSTDDSIKASVHRISGSDRYSTAIDLSKKAFDEADTAVIASGQNFADALSGGALAAINKAPLLLVDNTSSTVDKVNKELRRLGVKKVYILGGKNSISINTEMKISNDKDSDDKSRTVERIDGSDRYETSYKIYKEVARSQSGKEEVILVNGTEFADALSAGPLAAYTNRAIVLTDGKNLVSGLDKNNDKNIIIGGLSSMDSSFKGRRISGSDRYETSVKVAKELGSVDNVMLASGETYPDGLASISLYNKYKAPLLLSQRYSLPSVTKRYINDKSVKDIYIVGGTNSISTKVEDIFK